MLNDSLINKSHSPLTADIASAIALHIQRITQRGDLPHVTVNNQLKLLHALNMFPLGRHILQTGGANGFWTDYMMNFHRYHRNLIGPLCLLEDFFINRSMHVCAQRHLDVVFQKYAKAHLCSGQTVASIPCGIMRNLTTDFCINDRESIHRVGIDIDQEALGYAQELINTHYSCRSDLFTLKKEDAWACSDDSAFAMINSIGLNVYEPSREKVIDLYRNFYRSLTPSGVLFTGVLTYPPGCSIKSDWKLKAIPPGDLFLELVVFRDILDLKWMNFRTLEEISDDFLSAGFRHVEVVPDPSCVFPSIIAYK